MKKFGFPLLVTALMLMFMGFVIPTNTDKPVKSTKSKLVIPDTVQQVIDQSCYACHHTGAKSEKAIKALNFDKLTKLSTFKLVGKLQDIGDVISDEDMPPEKFLVKHPEKALTAEQKNLMVNWAGRAAEDMISKKK
jgi:uncharacterized membrane protein